MLGGDELERLHDEMLQGTRLYHSVYCGRCGYNLRTLPYAGQCPECGGQYNARPLNMTGIFFAHYAQFPLFDVLASAVSLLFTAWIIGSSLTPFSPDQFYFGLVFGAVSVVYGARTLARISRFLRMRGIAKRIELDEHWEASAL